MRAAPRIKDRLSPSRPDSSRASQSARHQSNSATRIGARRGPRSDDKADIALANAAEIQRHPDSIAQLSAERTTLPRGGLADSTAGFRTKRNGAI